MSHFAAMVAKTHRGWSSTEVDLIGVADIDEVADLMRDASVDEGPVLLFVEEDDEWFGIVRVDGLGEPRTFISDARIVASNELASVIFEEVPETSALADYDLSSAAVDEDEDDVELDDEELEDPVAPTDAEPKGSVDLLSDFGIGQSQLLALCADQGMLPADVIAAVCERLGCAEEIEVYR